MNKLCVENGILLGEVSRLIADGHEVTIMTKGNSMEPFIRGEMDSVLLRRPEEIKVGDIVLARLSGERYVLHRVFALDGDSVTMMGDGNIYGRENCKISDLAGKVKVIITPSGREVKPSDGSIWRRLMPVRRILLGLYRRLYRRKYHKDYNERSR